MKLEVGMYVRTERGKIWLVTSTKAIDGHRRRIVKASYNIIDLVQVGDYVNGYPVKSQFGSNAVCLDINYQKQGIDQIVKEQDIKSIVTKEQFEMMKYEIKRQRSY